MQMRRVESAAAGVESAAAGVGMLRGWVGVGVGVGGRGTQQPRAHQLIMHDLIMLPSAHHA